MKLVHLADLHLGYTQYAELTPTGQNQREADVHATFSRVIDAVIAEAPDVVLVAGDVFHRPRPSTNATVHAVEEFTRLLQARPTVEIVIAAGNHDLSGVVGGRCILEILGALGIHVVHRQAKRVWVPAHDLSILCVPDAPCINRPVLTPDPRAGTNVLLLHGEVTGMLPAWMAAERVALEISNAELGAERWDYVALGHYHVYTLLAANVAYAGSIDYTSSNPWKEIVAPKGFVVLELPSKRVTFHDVPPARPYVDLPAIHAAGLGASAIDALIAAAVESSPFDGHIVRLVVQDITVAMAHALDVKALKGYYKRATHFHVDFRKPDALERLAGGSVYEPALTAAEMAELLDIDVHELLDEPGADVDPMTPELEALIASRVADQTTAQSNAALEAQARAMNGGRLPYGMDLAGPPVTLAEIRAQQHVQTADARRERRESLESARAAYADAQRAERETGPIAARPSASASTVIAPTKPTRQRGAA